MGLVAAWGRYPFVVAEALKKQGYRVVCLGVVRHADPALAQVCDEFRWIGLGKLGGAIWLDAKQLKQLAHNPPPGYELVPNIRDNIDSIITIMEHGRANDSTAESLPIESLLPPS